MCSAEAIVNNRPLTTVSVDHKDPEPLTLNHLLLLRAGPSFPPGEFVKQDTYCRKRWRRVQYLEDIFWRRWTNEYLPSLQQIQKWTQQQLNVQEGDIVLLNEDTPWNMWQMGRVEQVFPSDGGLVRSIQVKTSARHPSGVQICKICLLESVTRGWTMSVWGHKGWH